MRHKNRVITQSLGWLWTILHRKVALRFSDPVQPVSKTGALLESKTVRRAQKWLSIFNDNYLEIKFLGPQISLMKALY